MSYEPKTLQIKPFTQGLGWPMVLMLINAAFMFGGIGGFAFFHSLLHNPEHEDLWSFGGSFIFGLAILGVLIYFARPAWRANAQRLVVDEKKVTLSFGTTLLNFGMIDFILWDKDYRSKAKDRFGRQIRTKLIIGYREGSHFEKGESKAFVFDAKTTPKQMGQMQIWYLTLMTILKAKRKLQREMQEKILDFTQAGDTQSVVSLLSELNGPDLIERSKVGESDDPRDKIHMLYTAAEAPKLKSVDYIVTGLLNNRAVTFVTNLWFAIVSVLITLFNLFIVAVLLTAL